MSGGATSGGERDGVMTLLHDTMEERAAAAPQQPVWPAIERGLRKARRRRRARTTGKVGAGLLAVTALAGGIQTNHLPYPAWATLPAAGGSSALAGGVTRGSLAGDTAWLDGLRQAIAAGEVEREDGGESWAPPAADDIDVIYAGDVGPYRIALVEGSWRWGVISERQQVWLMGDAGAAPGGLAESTNGSPDDVAVFVAEFGAYAVAAPPKPGQAAIVVVADHPVAAELREPVVYAADGTARRRTAPLPRTGDHLYETVITRSGTFDLHVPGRGFDEQLNAFPVPDAVDVPVTGALPPVHGTDVPPTDELHAEVAFALLSANLALEGTPRRLLWSGTVDDQRYRVVGLTAPSGARVLTVLKHDFSGRDLATWVVAGAALPAGPIEQSALAWPVATGSFGEERPTGRVAALGPAGATTAVFLAAGREVTRTALTDGFAVTEAATATSVRFLDAGGRAITERPISPLLGPNEDLAASLTR